MDELAAAVDEGELAVGVDLPELQAQVLLFEDLLVPDLGDLEAVLGEVDVGVGLEVADVLGAVVAGEPLEVREEGRARPAEEPVEIELAGDPGQGAQRAVTPDAPIEAPAAVDDRVGGESPREVPLGEGARARGRGDRGRRGSGERLEPRGLAPGLVEGGGQRREAAAEQDQGGEGGHGGSPGEYVWRIADLHLRRNLKIREGDSLPTSFRRAPQQCVGSAAGEALPGA